ncbi:xanthine permease [Nocardiopsis arvandica]|uniref:Xanthine permease n=1 Tax=Nocardiopsis sinuspersici TaxID=501010 RepID=A0A7Y9X8P2_9ACTN|nr:nucleobase:cation symporter-2 family protein [Nocardiopsis sinuspersici]NYH50472.1 xanthine permease [Nocardiopsis sinuspersici]
MKPSRNSGAPGPASGAPDTPPRPEDERPPVRLMVLYGLQHILAMYAGVVTPPLIVGGAVGLSATEMGVLISAALLVSGLATLVQTLGVWRFGARLPLVVGTSFVPVTAMVGIAGEGGLPAVFGASLAAGLFGLLIAPFFASLIRFFPPVVTGSVIAVIGLSLIPVAVGWITENAESGVPAPTGLGLAAATLAVILVLSKVLPGVWNRMSILLGLVLGTLLAAALGRVDFSSVSEGAMFSLGQPLRFGPPEFQIAAIVTMCLVMLVILTEGVADTLAVGEVVGTRMDGRRLGDALRADALSSVMGPLLNSFPGSTFSQNVGLIALSRVRSRYVVAVGALMLVAMGLFPVLGRLVAVVPSPVLGGAGLVLFGSVAAAGIRSLSRVEYEGNHNHVVVAVSMAFGLVPVAAPAFYDGFPSWAAMILHSGIVAAAVSALLLNAFFNMWGSSRDPAASGAPEEGPSDGESSRKGPSGEEAPDGESSHTRPPGGERRDPVPE